LGGVYHWGGGQMARFFTLAPGGEAVTGGRKKFEGRHSTPTLRDWFAERGKGNV